MCTLRSFPHNISHCLTFARSEFEGLLEKAPAEANAFLTSPAKYLAAIRQVRLAAGTPCLGVRIWRWGCWQAEGVLGPAWAALGSVPLGSHCGLRTASTWHGAAQGCVAGRLPDAALGSQQLGRSTGSKQHRSSLPAQGAPEHGQLAGRGDSAFPLLHSFIIYSGLPWSTSGAACPTDGRRRRPSSKLLLLCVEIAYTGPSGCSCSDSSLLMGMSLSAEPMGLPCPSSQLHPGRSTMNHWLAVQASDASAREQLEKVVELLVEGRCQSFEECIAWARRLFQVHHVTQLACMQLVGSCQACCL